MRFKNPPLRVLLKESVLTELPRVNFTGDAIESLGYYLSKTDAINLDDWEWYEEIRGGTRCCIITRIKDNCKLQPGTVP